MLCSLLCMMSAGPGGNGSGAKGKNIDPENAPCHQLMLPEAR